MLLFSSQIYFMKWFLALSSIFVADSTTLVAGRRGLGRCRLLQKIGNFSILQPSIAGRTIFKPNEKGGTFLKRTLQNRVMNFIFLFSQN